MQPKKQAKQNRKRKKQAPLHPFLHGHRITYDNNISLSLSDALIRFTIRVFVIVLSVSVHIFLNSYFIRLYPRLWELLRKGAAAAAAPWSLP